MTDIVLPELADAVYKDRIRDAKRNRRVSGMPETRSLPSVLRALIHFFAPS